MTMIYHITTPEAWHTAQTNGVYTAPALANVPSSADTNFIHCSTRAQVVAVANAFYRSVPELILLEIDTAALTAPVKWEVPADPAATDMQPAPEEPLFPNDDTLFPHVYGTINLEAVQEVYALPKTPTGDITLPPALRGDKS